MKKIALLVFPVLLITGLKLQAQDMALKTNLLYDATTTMNLGYEVALGRKTTLDIWVNYNPWVLGHKWVGLSDEQSLPVSSASASERPAKLKHLMIQPEVRWWLCEKFNGHFFGVHLHGGVFDVGALKMPFGWGRYEDADGNYLGSYTEGMHSANDPERVVNGIGYESSTAPYPGLVGNEAVWGNADRDGIYTNNFEGWFIGAGISYGYHWVLTRRLSLEFTLGVGYAFLDYEKSRCTDCKTKLGDETAHYFGPTRAGLSLVYMLK